MKIPLLIASLLIACLPSANAHTPAPEPGPEEGGLRLRLTVTPRPGAEGFDVRLEIVNVSERALTLRAVSWSGANDAALADYLEGATSIESYPPFPPWMGQVAQRGETSPQPSQALAAGAAMTVTWQTDGRRVKNKVTNPFDVQNPEFLAPGLYAIHASVVIDTGERTFLLRSNEQFISIGGSLAMPKHNDGTLVNVDAEAHTALLNIGSLQKVAKGDRFEINTMRGSWLLTIRDVNPRHSTATVEPRPGISADAAARQRFPEPNMTATLVAPK